MDLAELRAAAAQEQSETLDDLLSRWHHWQLGASVGRGHNSRSLVAGEYRTSRQYDDENGALYADEESAIMRAVQAQVDELDPQHRAAIYTIARGLHCGYMVWSSPRIPSDPALRDQVVQAARAELMSRLIAAGVM